MPIEDRVLVEELENIPGFVTAVLDGHGGFQVCYLKSGICKKTYNEIYK